MFIKMLSSQRNRFFIIIILSFVFTATVHAASNAPQVLNPLPLTTQPCIWEICSVDTMKTSRDIARREMGNPAYDTEIQRQVQAVKDTGANYIAIGTPYDEEFQPYLKRWVDISRKNGLKVWFRGNWSSWEGWFDYPKNMTPDQHLTKTSEFIKTHSDLFVDGDIFDACPECENSFLWPQTAKDQDYRDYIKAQHASSSAAFAAIGKKVRTDIPTIIGGRAKDVLDQATFDDLNKTVAIDHYVKSEEDMISYLNYFNQKFNTKVLVSEFGAPIPDINGLMTQEEQADFVDKILNDLYKEKGNVIGLNYFVLEDGSTKLLDADGSKRKVYEVLRKYYSPGVIKGRVVNTLGDPIKGVTVKASDGVAEAKTDKNGNYKMVLPVNTVTISINDATYASDSSMIAMPASRAAVTKNFSLKPVKPSTIYRIREFLKRSQNPV